MNGTYAIHKNDEVTLPVDYYEELLDKEKILDALHRGGVDNWEWYDEAVASIEEAE